MIPRLSRSQPMSDAGDRHGALERVGRGRVAEPRRDGRDQTVLASGPGRSPVCMSMKQPVP